jgi:hypothetical protein
MSTIEAIATTPTTPRWWSLATSLSQISNSWTSCLCPLSYCGERQKAELRPDPSTSVSCQYSLSQDGGSRSKTLPIAIWLICRPPPEDPNVPTRMETKNITPTGGLSCPDRQPSPESQSLSRARVLVGFAGRLQTIEAEQTLELFEQSLQAFRRHRDSILKELGSEA